MNSRIYHAPRVFLTHRLQPEGTGNPYQPAKEEKVEVAEIPSLMGEVDIIKYSLLLPGIQSAGEMDMSFNVRGGKGDQNLILVDGMNTYSHSHFFGLSPIDKCPHEGVKG